MRLRRSDGHARRLAGAQRELLGGLRVHRSSVTRHDLLWKGRNRRSRLRRCRSIRRRTVAELGELRALTGDENGAQRVAWTPTWVTCEGVAGRQARRAPARGGGGRSRQPVVDAARRLGARRPARRSHRLGPERRLARRLPERRRRGRGAAPDRGGGHAARDGAARQLGRRGGRPLRPLPLRLVGGRRLDGRPGRPARAEGPRRCRASGRAARARSRPRPRARGALAARERRRLPGAAHRAGAGARVDGPAARRRARHLRRRAPPDHLARPGRACRLDADGPAPRRARRRGQARARAARDRRRAPATAPC